MPAELSKIGIDTTTLLPGYPQVLEALDSWRHFHSLNHFFGGDAELLVGRHSDSGLEIIAINAPWLYDRPGNPYLDGIGQDWPDNHLRFAALAMASAYICNVSDHSLAPDVVHAHDWQAGLSPLYLRELGNSDVASVFTVHNIAFQGTFPPSSIHQLHLPADQFDVEGYEYHGQVGMLKAGMYYADKITTVSPTYAREIQTSEFGMGLEGLLHDRRRDLGGIVNGIDASIWNPETDQALKQTYGIGTLERRAVNKAAVQIRFGLNVEPLRPLFCIVSRLTHQKGMDLVLDALDQLIAVGGQLALIGTGDPAIEQAFTAAARKYQGDVGCIIGYDEMVSHQLQGGCDTILVPSRFEPCGLTQLYGLRYGCIPIVSRVGGLADTVVDANDTALLDDVATGIVLNNVSKDGLSAAIERAVELYAQTNIWRCMQRRGMSRQLNWARAAQRYAETYQAAITSRSVS